MDYKISTDERSKNEVIAHFNLYFDHELSELPCPAGMIAVMKNLINQEQISIDLNEPQRALATISQ